MITSIFHIIAAIMAFLFPAITFIITRYYLCNYVIATYYYGSIITYYYRNNEFIPTYYC